MLLGVFQPTVQNAPIVLVFLLIDLKPISLTIPEPVGAETKGRPTMFLAMVDVHAEEFGCDLGRRSNTNNAQNNQA
jgi:hypothetical protein